MNYNTLDRNWLNWFIGFIEGNGSFVVNPKKGLSFIITQREDNKHVLEDIAKTLQVGRVVVQTKHIVPGRLWTYRYIVSNTKDLHKILTIVNGNLVLVRRKNQFEKFVRYYNEYLIKLKISRKHKFKDLQLIEFKDITRMPDFNDAWLSGFTDAEGCFTITLLNNSNAFTPRFIIAQNITSSCNIYDVFTHIKDQIFGCGSIQKSHQKGVIDIRVNGLKHVKKIYPYFDKFILKTNKYNSYLIFKEMNKRLENKEHLDPEKREQLNNIYKNFIGTKGLVLLQNNEDN